MVRMASCSFEIHLPETVKNKQLMKIYETYVETLHYQWEETPIVRSFNDGGCETEEKMIKTVVKKCNQNNVKMRKLMLL